MAKVSNYKAQFCRQYFTQLKGFIKSFYLTKDDLGMRFLLDAYDFDKKNSHKKNQAYWNLDIEVDDKHLMLAIEEYYAITNGNTKLQEQRDKLFKGLIEPDNYADDDLIKVVFVDQTTMLEISKYFGIEAPRDPDLDNQINKFEIFIGKLDHHDIKTHKWVSFKDYAKALHILRLHRNNKAHLLTKLDTPERKIALQFLAFMYIGLTYILRMAWREHREKFLEAKLYKEPKEFDMPVQKLKVIAKVKDSSDDIIYAYEFRQSLQEESVLKGENTNNEKETFERSFNVKKYDKFKIGITFGHSDHKETLWFEDMLSYYYWQPTFEINLPTVYSLKPGLELNVENDKIEGLIAQLLDKTSKRNDGIAKDKESEIVNAILAGIEPILQRISALSHKTDKSKKEEDEQNKLTDSVIEALQNQTGKLDDILSKINDVKDENKGLTKKLDDLSVRLMKEIQELLADARQNKEAEVTSDRWKFFGKHWLPALTLLVASISIFGLSLTHDYSICWLENRIKWVTVFIILLAIVMWIMFYVDKTTIANRATIITRNIKWLRTGCLAMTSAFFLGAIFVVPHHTVDDFIENYNFLDHSNWHNEESVEFMKGYQHEHPESESVRIRLYEYYSLFAHDANTALSFIEKEPFTWNIKKHKRLATFYAEALFNIGNYGEALSIINEYQEEYKSLTVGLSRLKGIMLVYGLGISKNPWEGSSLLIAAADDGDLMASYYLGYMYSHDLTEYNAQDTTHLSIMNLSKAIYYLRKACLGITTARITLGNLYADLNMTDSAKYYYQAAIDFSGGKLHAEANFRMGLLHEKLGQSNNQYMEAAKHLHYGPAILHTALREKDIKATIHWYEKGGAYNGLYYIPPIVFSYIAKGDSLSALDTLKSNRPKAGFDMEFVKGMEFMLGTLYTQRDSVKGLEYMRMSKSVYAKMICAYKDIEKSIEQGDSSTKAINKLEEYGRTIPFAYILAGYLYKSIKMDDLAERSALEAIKGNHPEGTFLALTVDNESKWGTLFNNPDSLNGRDILWNQITQSTLRYSKDKSQSLFRAFVLETAAYKRNFSYMDMRLIADMAIANHNFDMEVFLMKIFENDLLYTEKLLISALNDLEKYAKSNDNRIQQNKRVMALNIVNHSEIRESLLERFENNEPAMEVITKYTKEFEKEGNYNFDQTITYNRVLRKRFSDRDLLDEFRSRGDSSNQEDTKESLWY